MPAPQISPLPTPPSRSQSPDTFSTDADAFLGALPDFQEEANDQADYLDALAVQVDADATASAASAAIAAGAANYQGDYNAGTTYQIGESVSYSGRRYVAKTVNTGVTPVDGANWFLINDGDVLGPVSSTDNTLPLFDGTTGKLLKGTLGSGTLGQILTSGGSGNSPAWSNPTGAVIPLEERTSNTMLAAADQGKYIKLNGNFTQTFDAAATLGDGWWCYLENTANPDVSAGVNVSSMQYIASANMPNISGAYQFCTNATGTRAYYIQTSLSNTVYQFDLSIANDITTAGAATAKNIGNISTSGRAIFFSSDGTKFFAATSSIIYQYTCSTPFDVTTAVYDTVSYSPGVTIGGARINSSGTEIYIKVSTTTFRTISLPTPWSLTGATLGDAQTSAAFLMSDYWDISPDGVSVIAGNDAYGLWEYRLSTPFDFSTATFTKRTAVFPENTSSIFGRQAIFLPNGNIAFINPSTNPVFMTLDTPTSYRTWRASDSFGVNDITLNPNGSETIDDRATMPLYPNEIRLVLCDGTNLKSVPLRGFVRHFQTTSDFYLPSGYSEIEVKLWGGGGPGGGLSGGTSGGGGGGSACLVQKFNTNKIAQTVRVVIGAGGAASTASNGGQSNFGDYLRCDGGRPAINDVGGRGGAYFTDLNEVTNSLSTAFGVYAGAGYILTNQYGQHAIYAGGNGGGGHTTATDVKYGGTSFYGSGGGGAGGANTRGGSVGGGTGGGLIRTFGSTNYYSMRIGGAPGLYLTDNNLYNADTNVPFGCGGGGGACRNSASYVGTGAKGGLGGGGGGGGGTYVTSSVNAVGGDGGDGFAIVRGII